MPAESLIARRGDGRRVYRLVAEDSPLDAEWWTSDVEVDKRPRRPAQANPLIHYGLTMFATEESAREANQRRRPPMTALAVVALRGEDGIWWASTFGQDHLTVWGRPDALTTCVEKVIPL